MIPATLNKGEALGSRSVPTKFEWTSTRFGGDSTTNSQRTERLYLTRRDLRPHTLGGAFGILPRDALGVTIHVNALNPILVRVPNCCFGGGLPVGRRVPRQHARTCLVSCEATP